MHYLTRLRLDPDALRQPGWDETGPSFYRAHQAIWQLFADSPERTRDFLFRKDGEGLNAEWYTLSERLPVDKLGIWLIDPMELEPHLEPGMRLRFLVRVNPTVSKVTGRKPDGKGGKRRTRSARHDVVMNAKRAVPKGDRARLGSSLIREACTRWLRDRAEKHGFDFEDGAIGVDGYRQLGSSASRGIRLSTVDLEGTLTVQDVERFTQMLFRGLGPAKSFGCGLMLIRRA